ARSAPANLADGTCRSRRTDRSTDSALRPRSQLQSTLRGGGTPQERVEALRGALRETLCAAAFQDAPQKGEPRPVEQGIALALKGEVDPGLRSRRLPASTANHDRDDACDQQQPYRSRLGYARERDRARCRRRVGVGRRAKSGKASAHPLLLFLLLGIWRDQ